MFAFLDLTDKTTEKRLMLRWDLLTAIQEHADEGTQVFIDGQPHWVKQTVDEVLAAIREVAGKMQSQQRQAMLQNGVVRR